MSQLDFKAAADALFGPYEPKQAQASLEAEGAVDTGAGISAALEDTPSTVSNLARQSLGATGEADNRFTGYGDYLRDQLLDREMTRADLTDGDYDSAATRAAFMLNFAGKYTPEQVVKAYRDSDRLNLPLQYTLSNLTVADRLANEIIPDDVKRFAPSFLRQIQHDADSALFWRHDARAGNGIASAWDAPGGGYFDVLGRVARKGVAGLGGMFSGAGRELFNAVLETAPFACEVTDDEGQTYSFQGIDRSGLEAIRDYFALAARQADEAREAIDAEKPPELQGRLWDRPELATSARWWLETIGDGAVSMATQIAMTALTGGGNIVAGVIGGLQEAEPFYQELVNSDVDETKARAAAGAFGITVAALNAFSFGKMFGKEGLKNLARKMAGREIVKEVGEQAGKSALKKIGAGSLTEGFTEWLENPFQAVYEAIARGEGFEQGVGRVIDSAKNIESFLVGGLLGAAGSGLHARSVARTEKMRDALKDAWERAKNSPEVVAAREELEDIRRETTMSEERLSFAQSVEQVVEAVDGHSLKGELPDVVERESEKLFPPEAREVWLDTGTLEDFARGRLARPEGDTALKVTIASGGQTFSQTENLDQSAAVDLTEEQQEANLARIGLTRDDLNAARQTGAQGVKVRTMALVARLQGGERQALLDAARTTEPGGMTAHEARSFDPRARATEAAERIRRSRDANAEIEPEITRLRNEFIQNAGFAPHVAEYHATMHGEQAKAFADRYGWDAVTLLRQRKVERGVPGRETSGFDEATFRQLNPGVDPNERIPVVDLSGTRPLKITPQEAKAFVQKWKGAPLEIATDANGKWKVVLSRKDSKHPFWSSKTEGRHDATRRAALAELEKVLAGARRIEDIEPKHSGVTKTIRFYAPVSRGNGNPVALRIVVHEMAGKQAEIDGVELYDIIRERPYPSSGRTTGGGLPSVQVK